MYLKIREDQYLNRHTLQQGDPETGKLLRKRLIDEGAEVNSILTVDFSVPDYMIFTYKSDVHSINAGHFFLHPLTAEERMMHNVRERKEKGAKGHYW